MKMCKLQITIVLYNYLIEFNKSHLYFKLNYSLMLRAILIISIILSGTIVILPLTNNNAFAGKVPLTNNNAFAGKVRQLFSPYLSKILGAKWWQWALEIPTPINPLIDANPCNVNQHGYFFFLGGVFMPVTTTATSGTSESSDIFQTRDAGDSSDTSVSSDTSGHIERTCTIPKGKAIFFPVYNAFQSFGPQPPDTGLQQPFRKR